MRLALTGMPPVDRRSRLMSAAIAGSRRFEVDERGLRGSNGDESGGDGECSKSPAHCEPPAARWTAPCRQRCGRVATRAKLESLHLSSKHLLVNFFLKRAKNFLLKLEAGLGNRQFV